MFPRFVHNLYISFFTILFTIYFLDPNLNLLSELPLNIWYPYDLSNPLLFGLSFVQVAIFGSMLGMLFVTTDLLLIALMMQILTQLRILNHRMSKFIKNHQNSTSVSLEQPRESEKKLIGKLLRDQKDIYQ